MTVFKKNVLIAGKFAGGSVGAVIDFVCGLFCLLF